MEEKNIFKSLKLIYLPLVMVPILIWIFGGNILSAAEKVCEPTTNEDLGFSYKPDAPVRSKVGEGYVLTGEVVSSAGCFHIQGAQIEFWLAGPTGYNDDLRGVVFSDKEGEYRFESIRPFSSSFRAHIHIRVTASGYRPLVTTHFLKPGEDEEKFDLVLIPLPL